MSPSVRQAALLPPEDGQLDRRGAFVVVTKPGRKEMEAAAPGHVANVRRLFIDTLTPPQLEAVAEAAKNIIAAFDEPLGEQADDNRSKEARR